VVAERAAAVGRVAQQEALAGLEREPAALEVAARGEPGGLLHQERVVVERRRLVDAEQAIARLLARGVGRLEAHAGAPREGAERLSKLDVVALHDEREGIPAGAAAETLPGLGLGEDVERGCLLRVEGTERAIAPPGPLEPHRTADQIDQVDAGLDFFDRRSRHVA